MIWAACIYFIFFTSYFPNAGAHSASIEASAALWFMMLRLAEFAPNTMRTANVRNFILFFLFFIIQLIRVKIYMWSKVVQNFINFLTEENDE